MDTDPENSILTEAHGLVHGERNADYDHPYTDYSRSVAIFKAWTGIELTPSQGIKFMRCVKMSREMSNPTKRDNYVDGAGYIECDRMAGEEERAREPWTGFITVEGIPTGDFRENKYAVDIEDPQAIIASIKKMHKDGFGLSAISIAHKMDMVSMDIILTNIIKDEEAHHSRGGPFDDTPYQPEENNGEDPTE